MTNADQLAQSGALEQLATSKLLTKAIDKTTNAVGGDLSLVGAILADMDLMIREKSRLVTRTEIRSKLVSYERKI